MKKRENGDAVTPSCGCCMSAVQAADPDCVLCPRRGVMMKDDACRKFRYDPLKRVPRKSPPPQAFRAEDFSLD